MGWRRVLRALHRDIGYVLVGLTLVYAVSGIAVNHVGDFNPNYRTVREEFEFEPFTEEDRDVAAQMVAERVGLPDPVDAYRPAPGQLLLIYDGWKVEAQPGLGRATSIRQESRTVLHALNRLHLNDLKGAWTWFADMFAVLLIFMALSGMFMLRGRAGLAGRGKWLVMAGLVIPVLALFLAAVDTGG